MRSTRPPSSDVGALLLSFSAAFITVRSLQSSFGGFCRVFSRAVASARKLFPGSVSTSAKPHGPDPVAWWGEEIVIHPRVSSRCGVHVCSPGVCSARGRRERKAGERAPSAELRFLGERLLFSDANGRGGCSCTAPRHLRTPPQTPARTHCYFLWLHACSPPARWRGLHPSSSLCSSPRLPPLLPPSR